MVTGYTLEECAVLLRVGVGRVRQLKNLALLTPIYVTRKVYIIDQKSLREYLRVVERKERA